MTFISFTRGCVLAAILPAISIAAHANSLGYLKGTAKTAIDQTGGVINADGTIGSGSGFSVTHPATGVYTVLWPANSFDSHVYFACTPASGLALCDIWSVVGNGGGSVSVQFRLYSRSPGSAQDNAFVFVEKSGP